MGFETVGFSTNTMDAGIPMLGIRYCFPSFWPELLSTYKMRVYCMLGAIAQVDKAMEVATPGVTEVLAEHVAPDAAFTVPTERNAFSLLTDRLVASEAM